MKVKKIPYRSCVVTKEKFPKQELLRIVKTKENTISVDPTGKLNGHGAYIKKDLAVLELAKSKKILNHVFEMEIPNTLYEEIESYITGGVR